MGTICFHLIIIMILFQQCFGIYVNFTNGENNLKSNYDKSHKPLDGMMNDQGDPGSTDGDSSSPDPLGAYYDFFSKYLYGTGTESTPIPPLGDMINATKPAKVRNAGKDVLSPNQPESHMDLDSFKELDHLSDDEMQDVIGVVQNFTVSNQLESQVDLNGKRLEELNLPTNNNTQEFTEDNIEVIINQPEIQIEVKEVQNRYIAQLVATLIFIIIGVYAIIFIVAVSILECKGKGRRTEDDEKYGSTVEKVQLLNGAAISEDTKYHQIEDEFDNFDKSYTNAALQLESSPSGNYSHSQLRPDRSDLHHLLGSPEAEVEVFPHGSLPRPPKKGCLQY